MGYKSREMMAHPHLYQVPPVVRAGTQSEVLSNGLFILCVRLQPHLSLTGPPGEELATKKQSFLIASTVESPERKGEISMLTITCACGE